jgi:hypothetical protein
MTQMTNEAAQLMSKIGQHYNLFFTLVSSSLLRMPSIIISLDQPGRDAVIGIVSPWWALLLSLGLNAGGLLLGVTYLGLLAQALPIGGAPRLGNVWSFVKITLRRWLQVIGLVLISAVVAAVIAVPVSLFLGMLALLAMGLASGVIVVMGMLIPIIMIYLYFVTAGLVMDDLPIMTAVGQSFTLVQRNFSRVISFVVLNLIIGWGIGMLLLDVTKYDPPFGVLIAIGINAFIGTGLALALLVFYRSHALLARGEPIEPL